MNDVGIKAVTVEETLVNILYEKISVDYQDILLYPIKYVLVKAAIQSCFFKIFLFFGQSVSQPLQFISKVLIRCRLHNNPQKPGKLEARAQDIQSLPISWARVASFVEFL